MTNYSELSPELQEIAKACQTFDELYKRAQEEGVEIPDDVLEQIAGGMSEPCEENLIIS
jgi:hypothetical protein